jgi:hypothetical protein
MPVDGNGNLEVGLSGNEGMQGITLILNIDIAPFRALVQGAGSAFRISTALFRQQLAQSPFKSRTRNYDSARENRFVARKTVA